MWPRRIPLRHLTLLEGDPGEGKSFVTQAIATAISLGKGLPGMDPTPPRQCADSGRRGSCRLHHPPTP
ncbi:MAG: hypothetical protein EXS58_17560 [Candidatus Latescibacteria bacterium]|nr:hypothetical protein [Candidatus Latescibacterota bacterium]